MSVRRTRRAWYRSSVYKGVFAPKELPDGSIVEGVQFEASDQFKITRIYPSGFQQDIVYRMLPNGETAYVSVGSSPPEQLTADQRMKLGDDEREARFEADLRAGQVRIATQRSAVPGNKPGDNYDPATRKTYTSRSHFEEEYARMKLAKVMQSDHSTMHTPSDPVVSTKGINIQSFNVRSEGFSDVPMKR